MGKRYTIPFADKQGNKYEVAVYQQGYSGAVEELRMSVSGFVVTGTDENFVYTPIRTSTANLNVLDKNVLTDLYSINNQYAQVKLLKNGNLEWTGYISPEQYTQPYRPTVQNVSIDCVSAIKTLENIEYKQQTESGFITLLALLRHLIASANGGYRGVYIPSVYGSTQNVTDTQVLEEMEVNEDNFVEGKMTHYDVLAAVMKLMNWTLHDIRGYLYLVDADWKGAYKLYDEALSEWTTANWQEEQVQNIGNYGADVNTLDVVPGYNKATVKSINNVFDQVINEEDYDWLEVAQKDYYQSGKQYWYKQFLRPKFYQMYYYDREDLAMETFPLTQEQIEQLDINTQVAGGVLMKIATFGGKDDNGTIVPDVAEYPWENAIQVDSGNWYIDTDKIFRPAFTVKGANAVWQDGAIGISMNIQYMQYSEKREQTPWGNATNLWFKLRIGDRYWNGEQWTPEESKFKILFSFVGRADLPSNKTPDMPYEGLSGWVIELPTDEAIRGDFELTMYVNNPALQNVYGYIIRNLRVDYAKRDGERDEGENGDRVYENIVNEDYMSEADEIAFEIGSYNEDGATYSKVLLNGKFLTDQLFCQITDSTIRPEELMIRRIVNRYRVTKIKLTEAIWNDDILTPITLLSERSQTGKKFLLTGGEWDYQQSRVTVWMQEDV